jgi:integrase
VLVTVEQVEAMRPWCLRRDDLRSATLISLLAYAGPRPYSEALPLAWAAVRRRTILENVVNRGIQALIPPDSGKRKGTRPGWDKGLYAFLRRVLASDHGQAIYRRRQATVEPVFGQMKFDRRLDRFQRRGRSAVRSEWRPAAMTHNLLKLHNHRIAAAGA